MPLIRVSTNEMEVLKQKSSHYDLEYIRYQDGYEINCNVKTLKKIKKELNK